MGKGNLKFGGKSGVLPPTRIIFKQPYKQAQIPARVAEEGYADDRFVPKHTSAWPKEKKIVSVDEKIQKYAPANGAAKAAKLANLHSLPEHEQWKLKNTEVRKEYYRHAVKEEFSKLEREEKIAAHKQKRVEQLKLNKENSEDSPAALLTLPTIDNILNQPLMRQRTAAENATLKAKREANRLHHNLQTAEYRAQKLLRLYNSSDSFIVTAEDLDLAINKAFEEDANLVSNLTHSINSRLNALNPPISMTPCRAI
ncbi:hypothetical protein BABINDRAFT_88472 [Babjeviella inositovora NRRL Y-12698]|uniref:Uncharacterized protein n=1 Tax=Babjeviella inositovora NRRL Y-12698 TaxID=984486 RepID=A0A1E3QKJ6_9ASCO|nr:uncharacterized protein BABINDRAFT_88472 [Babjeviella inositovora NRRL Y-12698]ODQ78205.1 hypothetical protein BABINDRAFT_88472 [Babjeviella inositovora NRRL Y-12698]